MAPMNLIKVMIIFWVIFDIAKCQDDFFFISSNKRLDNSSNKLIRTDLGFLQCLLECGQHKGCHSVNHHLDKMTCELLMLISSDEANSVNDAAGWNHYRKKIEWLTHPSIRFMTWTTGRLPIAANQGRMYRGHVEDDCLPSDAILTYERTQNYVASMQFVGHASEKYANRKILITFKIKFVKKVPPTGEIYLRVYRVNYYNWYEQCRPDKWCKLTLEKYVGNPTVNKQYNDHDLIALVFDTLLHDLYTIRIGYFDIKIL